MTGREGKPGVIIKEASVAKIPEKWRGAVDAAVDAYREHLGESLHSVYITGSVAKGKPCEGTSDLDTIAFVTTPESDVNTDWTDDVRHELDPQYPFAAGITMDVISIDEINESKHLRVLLKLESACVYGQDLALDLPDLHPGEETRASSLGLPKMVERALRNLADEKEQDNIDTICRGISRRILRSAYELVEAEEGVYTRELDKCAEGFAKHYPEQAENIRQALEWASSPSTDHDMVQSFVDGFGKWLVEEVYRKFGK